MYISSLDRFGLTCRQPNFGAVLGSRQRIGRGTQQRSLACVFRVKIPFRNTLGREPTAMAEHVNHLGQPIGFPLPEWTARPRPPRAAMEGRFCIVEPADPGRHAADLHAAYLLDKEGRNWTYLPHGPFPRFEEYRAWFERACASDDPFVHAIIDRRSEHAVGVASMMRIAP